MKLLIENLAKINSAEILIDGITVIAGENNTGKSTVGKILFSLFNSINGIEERIIEQRKLEIEQACMVVLNFYFKSINARIIRDNISRIVAVRVIEICNLEIDEDEKYKRIKDELYNIILSRCTEVLNVNKIVELLLEEIKNILNISQETILLEVFTRYFSEIFNNQINSLTTEESSANLSLEIKYKKINLSFKNNECILFDREIELMNKAIYIDNPFIINKLDSYENLSETDSFLKILLRENENKDIMDGIIQSVLAKEKLETVNKVLQEIIEGDILRKDNGKYYLQQENFKEPILMDNLSTGLKSFVLIKLLLEKGILKERDVLILDEPEIHLHPKWQVAYAELIVLLQKQFDLSIVVATHSPYFLDAIELYSIKYDIDKKVNFYLSSMDNDRVKMELFEEKFISLIENK